MVHHRQQATVDIVAFQQGFIKVHAAHHGTQVGCRDLHDGDVEVRHFICGFGCVEHLEENHGVYADHGVILCDDLLPRNVENLLHHIHLAAHAIKERDDDGQPGLSGISITPEPLNCENKALLHNGHAHHHKNDDDQRQ